MEGTGKTCPVIALMHSMPMISNAMEVHSPVLACSAPTRPESILPPSPPLLSHPHLATLPCSSNNSLLAGRGGEEEGADDHEELSLLAGEDGGGDDEWGIESRGVAAQRQPVRGYIPRLYIGVCVCIYIHTNKCGPSIHVYAYVHVFVCTQS
jgi:hypothetical protein